MREFKNRENAELILVTSNLLYNFLIFLEAYDILELGKLMYLLMTNQLLNLLFIWLNQNQVK